MHRSGFTLPELLVGLLLSSMAVSLAAGVFFGASTGVQSVQAYADQHGADVNRWRWVGELLLATDVGEGRPFSGSPTSLRFHGSTRDAHGWVQPTSASLRLEGASLQERRAQHDAIDDALRQVFAGRDREGCLKELLDLGIPAAPVVDARALGEHPQLVARRTFEEVDHVEVGPQRLMSVPFRAASVDHWITRPAPTLGEHNHEVLGELGLSADEIARLESDEVIGTKPKGL